MFCNIQKKYYSTSQRKSSVEGPKRKLNRVMGPTVKTQYANAHLPGREVKKPCCEQRVSDVIEGRNHQIPPSMLILPPKVNPSQGNQNQPISNVARPHSRSYGKIPSRFLPHHRQRAYEKTTKRDKINQTKN